MALSDFLRPVRRLVNWLTAGGWVSSFFRAVVSGGLRTPFVATLPRVVIVGAGGTGKSTLLKQMLAHAASGGAVPVWVPLSTLPTEGTLTPSMLVDHLVEQARSRLGLGEVNRAFFDALIQDGQLAIGFDALDECGSLPRRQKVRGLIADVAREWTRCRVFVTSRPEAYRETPLPLVSFDTGEKPREPWAVEQQSAEEKEREEKGRFLVLTPVPFGRDDVAPFLRATFEDGDALAKELLGRTGIEALLETPLTLTLIGQVARRSNGLPVGRTALFARCLDTVAETWDDAKNPRLPADGLDANQRRDVLRRLGWEAQQTVSDALEARSARVALSRIPEIGPGRAKTVVDGLARRNLLLKAEVATDGAFEVRRIRFAHSQFREYLAGAHLAEQFDLDPVAATTAMRPHWADTEWLDPLRFAVTTLERDPDVRDRFLEAVQEEEDDLSAPDGTHFLTATLLAAVAEAEPEVVDHIVTTLERVAIATPALGGRAAQALIALGRHERARAAIERLARGEGLGQVAAAHPDLYRPDEAVHWRLRAIEALLPAKDARAALALLPTGPLSVGAELDVNDLRRRLGDRTAARGVWTRLFDAGNQFDRAAIGVAMDKADETALFNGWLAARLEAPDVTVGDATLARKRDLLQDAAPVWSRLFARASAALAALPADEPFAPDGVSATVYAALDTGAGAASPEGRSLVAAALAHPALVWYVGPRVGKAMPELAHEAARRLAAYVLDPPRVADRPDESRVNVALHALCDELDDSLAVPALLELLKAAPDASWAARVADALRKRGHEEDVLALRQGRNSPADRRV